MTCDGRRAEFAEETAQRLAVEMTPSELGAAYHRHNVAGRPRLRALTFRALTIQGHQEGRLGLLDQALYNRLIAGEGEEFRLRDDPRDQVLSPDPYPYPWKKP